ITTEESKILLDCGLFQGNNDIEELNYEPFGFNPSDIDFVVLSHAHIDHSGRLPLLVKQGFEGKIYCTDATADLLDVMLKDSGYIQEKETEWKNRKNERAGRPLVEPLYTVKDAEVALRHVEPVLYDQLIEPSKDVKVVFNDAGHILGSAIIELFVKENGESSKLVFTGDLGIKNKPILRDPTIIKKADFIIMEATYGNRVHEAKSASIDNLINIVLNTTRRGGNVIIPSFAVGRTQELIYLFNRFYEEHEECRKMLDDISVYVDSPMATTATEVFRRNAQVFDEETKAYILKGNNPLDFKNLIFTRSVEESVALNFDPKPKVIISASGMCEAGRIKHHLKHNLWNPLASIVFVGYQSTGTLGRSLLDGDKGVSIFGEKIYVKAEIHSLQGFSGHADRDGLMEWVGGLQRTPFEIFLVHGESDAKKELAETIREVYGYNCTDIHQTSEYTLSKEGKVTREDADSRIASPESMWKLKKKMHTVHDELETILYNTHLAVGSLSPEQVSMINNLIFEIEKDVLNLGSAISLEE
ncbi:MAG TPA: MBL fold metallo-hydrolase, partial [Anaerovoracaceae bacterium]|nr:MBL fold metallo-hydrolase [Anaerovoracaceae bacterium]